MTTAVPVQRPAVSVAARPGPPLGLIFLGLGLAAVIGVGVLHLDRLPFSICVFKAVTGYACLTCGATRALARLARLDLAGALAMNPIVTLAALGMVPWGLADLLLLPRRLALTVEVSPRTSRVLRVLAVVLVIANWIYLIATGR